MLPFRAWGVLPPPSSSADFPKTSIEPATPNSAIARLVAMLANMTLVAMRLCPHAWPSSEGASYSAKKALGALAAVPQSPEGHVQTFARILDGKGLLRDDLSAERARAGLLEANPRKRVDILGHDPRGVNLPVNGVADESVTPFTATPMAPLRVVELAAGFGFYLARDVRIYVCADRRFGNLSTSNVRNHIGRIALWRHHTSFCARLASSTVNNRHFNEQVVKIPILAYAQRPSMGAAGPFQASRGPKSSTQTLANAD